MKYIYFLAITPILFTTSLSAFANFDYTGQGEVTYPTGVSKPFEFGFAWDKTSKKLRIGNKSYDMGALPESYNIAITLGNGGEQVWVQEFNPGFISEFSWTLGEHTLTLKKKQFNQEVKGNYVISVNNIDYFFARNNVIATVFFKADGVSKIKLDGVNKDMGTKGAEK